ncbi:MAG: ribonuclease III [Deltaproteobacteria bacterium]|nr:ribonuclease III [Deltaproteobacteria bacterium]
MSIQEFRNIQELEDVLDYQFTNGELLLEALTHSTFANENKEVDCHNERLEFVGDSVFGMMAATLPFRLFPDEPEGKLSQRRSRTVSNQALSEYAASLRLGDWLRMGQGQRDCDGHVPSSLLADAMEAVVGAVYLDGGLAAVTTVFENDLKDKLLSSSHFADYKTRLQEACHRKRHPAPNYRVVATEGPAHAPTFTCSVNIAHEEWARANGSSKSQAEQDAAKTALERLEEKND